MKFFKKKELEAARAEIEDSKSNVKIDQDILEKKIPKIMVLEGRPHKLVYMSQSLMEASTHYSEWDKAGWHPVTHKFKLKDFDMAKVYCVYVPEIE